MGAVRFLLTRLMAVLAVAGTATAAAPGTAAAGGPTSVLLASPFADAAAGLYYTDPDYSRLQILLGGPDLPTGAPPPPAAAGSPYVTATWLIHDVDAWRIDRIFLVGDGVWVVSELSGESGPLTGDGMYPGQTGNAAAVWHRPTDPAALIALLGAHGLTPGSARPDATVEPPANGASAVSAAAAARGTADTPVATGWFWAIGGLLAGLLAGGALVRAATARRVTPRPEPATHAAPVRMRALD
jgi:hypothetical protein